jgi:hypothetical protein
MFYPGGEAGCRIELCIKLLVGGDLRIETKALIFVLVVRRGEVKKKNGFSSCGLENGEVETRMLYPVWCHLDDELIIDNISWKAAARFLQEDFFGIIFGDGLMLSRCRTRGL